MAKVMFENEKNMQLLIPEDVGVYGAIMWLKIPEWGGVDIYHRAKYQLCKCSIFYYSYRNFQRVFEGQT